MLPPLDLKTCSLEQLIETAQSLASAHPAETAKIYSMVVDRVCEYEEKIRYQDLSSHFEVIYQQQYQQEQQQQENK